MRCHRAILLTLIAVLVGCARPVAPTLEAPGPDVPFPPTWTPTTVVESTSTATLVVLPTPTWDGTPPPPSAAEVPQISTAKLYREIESDEYAIVDVRNFAAYKQAHIADAVHIPLEELSDRAGELDGNKTVVCYDLSPNEFLGVTAAIQLYDVGFTKIAVLQGGLQKWYSDGYPIEGTLLTPTPGAASPPWSVTPLTTTVPTATVSRTPTRIAATSTMTPTATPEE
jgi:rhodanese-related sulfurtransferase